LRRQGVISSWHDRQIVAGSEWEEEIDRHMKTADIILLLVSPDFVASKYCYEIELPDAMARHEAGEAYVVPILLRPVAGWEQLPFAKLQVHPSGAVPITQWSDQDNAFVDVAKGIEKAVRTLLERQQDNRGQSGQGGLGKDRARHSERKGNTYFSSKDTESQKKDRKLKRIYVGSSFLGMIAVVSIALMGVLNADKNSLSKAPYVPTPGVESIETPESPVLKPERVKAFESPLPKRESIEFESPSQKLESIETPKPPVLEAELSKPPVPKTETVEAPESPMPRPESIEIPKPPTRTPENRSLPVYANQGWIATDVCFDPRDSVEISADGDWSNGYYSDGGPAERKWYGATGYGESGDRSDGLPVPSAQVGALIGKLDNGQPFFIGNATTKTIQNRGCLFLGINDSTSSLDDNDGKLIVRVQQRIPGL
jgi:hypothetical protein